jgi:hypothetical protein
MASLERVVFLSFALASALAPADNATSSSIQRAAEGAPCFPLTQVLFF